MQLRFGLLKIFLGFLIFSACSYFDFNLRAQESFEINLNQELKKGNFLIGLKQYLGGKFDNYSESQIITFSTSKDFLTLQSSNGIIHKSKKISILWKIVPLKNPYVVKRKVFGPFSSYESAKKQAEILQKKGYKVQIAYPKNWEVWVPFETQISEKINYKLFQKNYKSRIVPFLTNEYTQQKLEGPIYISSKQKIKINKTNFGKNFVLARDSYGTWTLIQKIKFDNYLKGVLPHEIGANSHLEALKAQAVIARTWGIYNSERFKIDKFHLCISTQCQVYKPPKEDYKSVQKAIKETANLIIKYKNKPINAFYHGSNGGLSARAGESWEMEEYSYFKPMIDGTKSVKKYFKIPIKNKDELNKFLDFSTKELYGNYHPLFRWKKKIPNSEINNILIKNKLMDKKSNFVDLNILERGLSGRVTKLEFKLKNSNKSVLLIKDDIRKILKFLPSNLFTIDKLNDNFWIFRGGGFGHGVGLSQSGAISMAEMGFTYEQILNHYYPGTKIEKIEILSDY